MKARTIKGNSLVEIISVLQHSIVEIKGMLWQWIPVISLS